jgi:transposase
VGSQQLRRNFARMRLLHQQIREIERERLRQLAAASAAEKGPARIGSSSYASDRRLHRDADMLVNEILARGLGDRRAVARPHSTHWGARNDSNVRPSDS